MTHYTLMLANSDHIKALPGIERAAAALFPTDLLPAASRLDTLPLDVRQQAAAEGRLWIAETSEGWPVGFSIVVQEGSAAYLQELDVHPDHQRRGLGRRLAEVVVDWARQQGLEAVTLTTFSDVPWNAPFYETLGFRRLAEDVLSEALREHLRLERASGLVGRVAMRLDLRRAD
ncbi:GNAT family N-acetyltransferase [Pseudomonas sp. Marseille-QA0892]